MNKPKLEIKLAFIIGLREIVLNEINQYPDFHVTQKEEDFIYLNFKKDFTQLECLRSVLRVYIVARGSHYHPLHISNHKSIAGDLVAAVSELENADSFLNIFSGSATLLIEAGQCFPNLKQLVGFDNNKENLSLAIQNIRKAGLIKKIRLKEGDIFDKPSLGKFDVITSDPPFGMLVSKYEDLENLYRSLIEYCQDVLNDGGTLAVYTSRHELFRKKILGSKFKIIKKLDLKFMTSANTYLHPKIFICKLKKNRSIEQ